MGILYDKAINEDAGEMFLSDLSAFSNDDILSALKSCRTELNKFPTVADIISRVQKNDGRPGVEEAWSLIPRDEASSIVWTEEMGIAWSVASPLIDEDLIAARMAFKERYESAIRDSRAKGLPVKWLPSFGHDKAGREMALREAIDKNRITLGHAQKIMPEFEIKKTQIVIGNNPDATAIQKLIGEVLK